MGEWGDGGGGVVVMGCWDAGVVRYWWGGAGGVLMSWRCGVGNLTTCN